MPPAPTSATPISEPDYEPTYEDLECCLITLRDVLRKMRPTKAIENAIRTIDRAVHGEKEKHNELHR
jgi:hypothetical protein